MLLIQGCTFLLHGKTTVTQPLPDANSARRSLVIFPKLNSFCFGFFPPMRVSNILQLRASGGGGWRRTVIQTQEIPTRRDD